MAFTEAQNKVLSIIPHVTGPFSFIGSSWILYEVASDKSKWTKPYHRLLFSMAFFDALSSVALAFSTIPIPRNSPGVYSPMGTQGTCSAQAFFVQANIASPLYNFCLSLYYLFLVKYAISERTIRQRIEPWMQVLTIVFALGTSFVCLGLGMLNDSQLWCWINALPKGCSQSYNSPDGEGTCTRGDNAEIFRWLFFFAPLWAAIVGTMVTMYMLYRAVRVQEDKVSKWTSDYVTASQFAGGVPHEEEAKVKTSRLAYIRSSILSPLRSGKGPPSKESTANSNAQAHQSTQPNLRQMKLQRDESVRQHRKSNMVMWQAFRYVAVFWLTWTFGSLNRILQLTGRNVFWVMVLHAIFVPLQGALNFLVYKYAVFYKWKEARRKARKKKKKMAQAQEGGAISYTTTTSVAFTKRFSGMSTNSTKAERAKEYADDNEGSDYCASDNVDDDGGSQDGVIRSGVTLSAKQEEKTAAEEEKSPDV